MTDLKNTSGSPALDLSASEPPPPRELLALPPAADRGPIAPSVLAARSPVTHVRHVAITTPTLSETTAFYVDLWGLYPVASASDVVFLGAVGSPEPYIVRIRAAAERRTDLIAFGIRDRAAVDTLADDLGRAGVRLVHEPRALDTPGGGYGFRFFDPDGRQVEASADVQAKPHRELAPRESVPRKLSHVVLDTANIADTMAFYTRHLGFRLSDWLEDRMCFLRCSADHHSLALTRRGRAGLNHISFEMLGLDEYMRGTGRLVRARREPLWGPGRHGPGDNVYSYFAGPDDFVVEYTTALERITDEDAWIPRVWPATKDYADRWGTAGPGEDLFALHHRTPAEAGLWTPSPI